MRLAGGAERRAGAAESRRGGRARPCGGAWGGRRACPRSGRRRGGAARPSRRPLRRPALRPRRLWEAAGPCPHLGRFSTVCVCHSCRVTRSAAVSAGNHVVLKSEAASTMNVTVINSYQYPLMPGSAVVPRPL